MRLRLSSGLWAIALSFVASPTPSEAQHDFPTKPIRLVVPAPPGGELDPIARALGDRLHAAWGQPVVVDNKPGAASIIATSHVAKAPPDGYTLLLCSTGGISLNPSLYPTTLPYDPIRDIEPIASISTTPMVLVAKNALGIKSVNELLAYARAKPGALNYASAGNGNLTHIAGAYFSKVNDLDMVHVPYKGSGPATMDLLAGQIDLYFNPLPSALGYLKDNKARALAVTTSRRSAFLPEVPTLEELGIKGFNLYSWFGLCGPAGMPQAVVRKINQEVTKALNSPVLGDRLRALGTEAAPKTPEQFAQFIREEIEKWGTLIRSNGIKPE